MKTLLLTVMILLLSSAYGQCQIKFTKADSLIMNDRVWIRQYELYDVSMIKLLSTPERYNGKHVIVRGYLSLGFESDLLYFHEEDYKHNLLKNALWINLDDKTSKYYKYTKHYVRFEAVFDANDTGHMGLASGGLKDIKRIDIID